MLSSLEVHRSNNSGDLGNHNDGHSFGSKIMILQNKHPGTEELLSTVCNYLTSKVRLKLASNIILNHLLKSTMYLTHT